MQRAGVAAGEVQRAGVAGRGAAGRGGGRGAAGRSGGQECGGQECSLTITIEGVMEESPAISLLDYDVLINVQDVSMTSRRMGIDFILLTDAHQLSSF